MEEGRDSGAAYIDWGAVEAAGADNSKVADVKAKVAGSSRCVIGQTQVDLGDSGEHAGSLPGENDGHLFSGTTGPRPGNPATYAELERREGRL